MKILYLITKSEAGGAQTYVNQLAQYFSKGNQVAIMSDGRGWLYDQASKLGIKFFKNRFFSNSINPIAIIRSLIYIRKVIKEYNPDLIHYNSSVASFLGRLVVRKKIPTIFTAHGWSFNTGVPTLQKFFAIIGEKLLAPYCTKIICVSNFVKDLGVKYRITNNKKFVVIHNGVKIREQSNNIDKEKIKLIFIGRLAEPKNPLLLLETINSLPNNTKNKFEISIVGDGEKRTKLEEYINQNKLSNIKLLGQLSRENTLDVLSKSNALVFLSKWEGFPYVILEAMSFGIPVISSNVGGIKELVDDKCGTLLKNNKQLKVELEKIADDNSIIMEKGEKARNKIMNNFSMDKMLDRISEVYRTIIK